MIHTIYYLSTFLTIWTLTTTCIEYFFTELKKIYNHGERDRKKNPFNLKPILALFHCFIHNIFEFFYFLYFLMSFFDVFNKFLCKSLDYFSIFFYLANFPNILSLSHSSSDGLLNIQTHLQTHKIKNKKLFLHHKFFNIKCLRCKKKFFRLQLLCYLDRAVLF